MERITLVCTSLKPKEDLLNKMLESANGFDEIILHIDEDSIEFLTHYDEEGISTPNHLDVGQAYNLMINYVETEWVCCFCDDDFFYPDGLSKMISEVHKGIDADIAHFKFHISGYAPPEDKRCWFGRKEYDLCEKKKISPQLLAKHARLPAGSFFRKCAWEKVSGFQGKFEHDRNLWLRMSESGCTFKYFDYLVYNFVRRKDSAWIRQRKTVGDRVRIK